MNVNCLLAKMSLDEKVAQLYAEGVPDAMMTGSRFDAAKADALYPHGLFGLSVHVFVENRGAYPAEEPLLLFLRDEYASVAQPARRLCAIGRISLASGEARQAELFVPDARLSFTDLALCRRLERGSFTVEIGGLCASVFVDRERVIEGGIQ